MLTEMVDELLSKAMEGCDFTLNLLLLSGSGPVPPFAGFAACGAAAHRVFFSRPLEHNENSSSQRNSLEEGIKSEQRTNSMSG